MRIGNGARPVTDLEITQDNTREAADGIRSSIDRALEQIGLVAEGYAKAACPVGTPESTGIKGYVGGRLRNSITHVVDESTKTVYIGTNVEYAPYVELGTKHQKAQPYLRPAAEDHTSTYADILKSELGS